VANSSQQFYNLNTDPFRLSPDHQFSFSHSTYKKGLADLKLALVSEEGFIVITGRPGTGKTTLLNEAIAQLDVNKFVVATLITTRFEAHDLWSMIASSFGQNCSRKSSSVISLELEKFLRMKHSEGKRALLIVDEAQGLGEDVLDELQLLSNLQDDEKPLLQVILIGPEELKDAINSPKPENSGKGAISASQLDPLSESETIDYITHRLNHAGWKGDPAITKGAGCLVHYFSGGIPRVINRICSRFLLYGCAEKKHKLNAGDMKSVLEELSDEQLVSKNTVVLSDLDEKVNILENEYIKPLRRIKKTSIETLITQDDPVIQLDAKRQQPVNAALHIEDMQSRHDLNAAKKISAPTEHPGVVNNQASTIATDENTENVSVESNSCRDTHDSNDASQTHIEEAAIDSPSSQVLDTRERVRWPGNYAWLAVPAVIAIAVGLIIYSGAPQDPAQIQSQADIGSRSPVHQIQLAEKTQLNTAPANDKTMRDNKVGNYAVPVRHSLDISTYDKNNKGNNHDAKEKHLDRLETEPERVNKTVQSNYIVANTRRTDLPADNPGTATRASQTSTIEAVKPVKPKQAEIYEIATDTSPIPTETTPELMPARIVKTAPPVITKPAGPTGEKQPVVETKTAKAPDISAEQTEPTELAAPGKSVLPGKTDPPAIDRPNAAPIKQGSKSLARPSPEVKVTAETLTPAKAGPVIIQPEKTPKPVKKKPQKVQVTSNTIKAADSASLTMDTLLARQWITDTRQQAPHLPSFITNCSATPRGGECWSREYIIKNSGKSVRVKTKSYLKDFTESGFTIRYKHMLLGGANEKRRWEDKTHQLDCKIIYRNKIKCNENGANGAVIFTQNTSD